MSYLDLAKRAEALLRASTLQTEEARGRASQLPGNLAGGGSSEESERSEGRLIAERAAIFRRASDDWARSGHVALPVIALPDAPNLGHGFCASCAAVLSGDETWRCQTCVAALNVVLDDLRKLL